MAAAHLLLYAQQHLCLERRARHAASRPTHGVRAGAAARAWWGYAAKAAAAEWGGRRMPLGAELLRVRREYLEAYRESLLADTGGPNLSAQVEPRPPGTYPLPHAPSTYSLSHTHTRRPCAPLSRHRHRHRPAPLAPPLLRPPRPFGVALHRPSVARARPWQSAARLLAAEQHCLSVEQICAFRALAAAQSLGALRALRVERERKRRERERRLKERAGPYLP